MNYTHRFLSGKTHGPEATIKAKTLPALDRAALTLLWILAIAALAGAEPALAVTAPEPPTAPVLGALPVVTVPFTATCAYSAATAAALQQTSEQSYGDWIRKLSGALPVEVGGQPYTILTRYSPALFDGTSKAFDYLKEQMLLLYPASQVEEFSYNAFPPWSGQVWKDLVVTIPGKVHPEQAVIMSAHFDSRSASTSSSMTSAPGADDNGTGAASLLEAARVLRGVALDRTVKLVWFTGEEQGLWGSGQFTAGYDLTGVIGDVNLDMFGYDGDGDRCFELHVSQTTSQPSYARSNSIGQCMGSAIANYGLNLKYDYLTLEGLPYSDHASFWEKGIGAVEVLENFSSANNKPNGCTGMDKSPNYHQTTDTIDQMNIPFAFTIHKAGLATVIDLANSNPISDYIPLLTYQP